MAAMRGTIWTGARRRQGNYVDNCPNKTSDEVQVPGRAISRSLKGHLSSDRARRGSKVSMLGTGARTARCGRKTPRGFRECYRRKSHASAKR